jgi:hypothetical protein
VSDDGGAGFIPALRFSLLTPLFDVVAAVAGAGLRSLAARDRVRTPIGTLEIITATRP